MGKLNKEYTPGSNLASMTPEERAEVEEFHKTVDMFLVEGLNRAVMAEKRRREQEQAEQSLAEKAEAQPEKKD